MVRSRRVAVTKFALAAALVVATSVVSFDASPGACPASMARVDDAQGAFCIDRWEAGLVDVVAPGRVAPHSPFESVGGRKVRAVSSSGVVPQGYISGIEARAACQAAGKRLCSSSEWQRACMGKNPTKYPYGDDEVPGRCNGDGTRRHPILELFGDGSAFGDPAKMNDPRINHLPNTLSRTGTRARCRNSYGVFDMVGNLHEWIDDPGGEFRGGYYMDTHKNGDGCMYRTTAHDMSYHDYSTGFRCCK